MVYADKFHQHESRNEIIPTSESSKVNLWVMQES